MRIQQVAECWVPAGEPLRFEHEYDRFANFSARSRAPVPDVKHALGGVLASAALRAVSKRAIKVTHAALVFMEELAGVTEKFSAISLYVSIKN